VKLEGSPIESSWGNLGEELLKKIWRHFFCEVYLVSIITRNVLKFDFQRKRTALSLVRGFSDCSLPTSAASWARIIRFAC
jgi:hypothetical protein